MLAHTFNPRALRQGQAELCEFQANLVYIVEFQARQGYIVKPALNIKIKGIFQLYCNLMVLRSIAD